MLKPLIAVLAFSAGFLTSHYTRPRPRPEALPDAVTLTFPAGESREVVRLTPVARGTSHESGEPGPGVWRVVTVRGDSVTWLDCVTAGR